MASSHMHFVTSCICERVWHFGDGLILAKIHTIKIRTA